MWFEHSAHMPYYEEPIPFREALLRALELTPGPVLYDVAYWISSMNAARSRLFMRLLLTLPLLISKRPRFCGESRPFTEIRTES